MTSGEKALGRQHAFLYSKCRFGTSSISIIYEVLQPGVYSDTVAPVYKLLCDDQIAHWVATRNGFAILNPTLRRLAADVML